MREHEPHQPASRMSNAERSLFGSMTGLCGPNGARLLRGAAAVDMVFIDGRVKR